MPARLIYITTRKSPLFGASNNFADRGRRRYSAPRPAGRHFLDGRRKSGSAGRRGLGYFPCHLLQRRPPANSPRMGLYRSDSNAPSYCQRWHAPPIRKTGAIGEYGQGAEQRVAGAHYAADQEAPCAEAPPRRGIGRVASARCRIYHRSPVFQGRLRSRPVSDAYFGDPY